MTPIVYVAFGAGAIASALVTPIIIGWQLRRELGQQIYESGPQDHARKQGTPTMGGLAFLLAVVVGLVAFNGPSRSMESIALACLVVAAGLIGLADDALSLTRRRALGLKARWKLALLAIAAIAYVAWVAHARAEATSQFWFGGPIALPVWLWFALAVLAIVGASNAVNLTDGLDGLAAGVVIPPLFILSYATGSTVGASVLGSCVGFLWFNKHPARVFMGDTGSLALGALVAGLAIENFSLLLLPLLCAVFVAEAVSVIAQVVSFKITGKRVLKMSPLHHHFELSGWSESKVTATFVATSCACALGTYLGFLFAGARGSLH